MALAGPCWSSQYQGVLQQLTGGAASFVVKRERSQLARLQNKTKYRSAGDVCTMAVARIGVRRKPSSCITQSTRLRGWP
jgi:hypothetical protein